jgi:molybdopterin converting factor small subunit
VRAALTVRYFAAARDAAGTSEEQLPVADGVELAAVLTALVAGRGGPAGRLGQVLARCSFLLDGQQARPEQPLGESAILDVLPPFAGG